MKNNIIVLGVSVFMAINCFSQRETANGYTIPVKGTVKCLVVFCEVENTACGGVNSGSTNWPAGSIPLDADNYFDLAVSNAPQAKLSRILNEASFGQYNVICDYFKEVVTIPCADYVGNGTANITSEIENRILDNLQNGTSVL